MTKIGIAFLCMLFCLTGCGQTGKLYLPDTGIKPHVEHHQVS